MSELITHTIYYNDRESNMPDRRAKRTPQPATGLTPAHTRRHWRHSLAMLTVAACLALAACGEDEDTGSASTPTTPPEPTAQEKIAQLEASGKLPRLERLPLVEGVDADNDGVRDDIADYIRNTYTEPVQYRAAMQMARAFQMALRTDVHDAMALQRASDASNRAIVCTDSAFPGDAGFREAHSMMTTLESMTANTKERLQAYLAYNKAQSGSVSTDPVGAACD